MKNELKQQARNLFLDTDLNKTEIASRLNVDRRTIRIWSQEGNWENLRRSSRHLPSMVAEKCYYILDQYASHLLSENAAISTFSVREADAINKMASGIKKLKARSTVNESMEMFNFFLESVNRKNPQMAQDISPYIDDYITGRKDIYVSDFQLSSFDEACRIPCNKQENDIMEQWADEDDDALIRAEIEAVQNQAQQDTPEENNEQPISDSPAIAQPLQHPTSEMNSVPADNTNTAEQPAHSEETIHQHNVNSGELAEPELAEPELAEPELAEAPKSVDVNPPYIASIPITNPQLQTPLSHRDQSGIFSGYSEP